MVVVAVGAEAIAVAVVVADEMAAGATEVETDRRANAEKAAKAEETIAAETETTSAEEVAVKVNLAEIHLHPTAEPWGQRALKKTTSSADWTLRSFGC